MPLNESSAELLAKAAKAAEPKLADGSSRRQAVAELLRSLKTSWRTADDGSDEEIAALTRDIFSMLVAVVGFGDVQLQDFCLAETDAIRLPAILQAVLDNLPAVLWSDDDNDKQIVNQFFEMLHSFVLRDRSVTLPVMNCVALLPLSESCRCRLVKLARSSLQEVEDDGLPTVLKTLLSRVCLQEEASSLWEDVRQKAHSMEGALPSGSHNHHLSLLYQLVLDSFGSLSDGDILAESYLSQLERSATTDTNNLLVIDAVIALALSTDDQFCDDIDRIMDVWLARGCFPFGLFVDKVMMLVQVGSSCNEESRSPLYYKLVPGLLRLVIFLLLAPARISELSECSIVPTENLVQKFYASVDIDRQKEIIKSLLLLSDQTAEDPPIPGKRRRPKPREKHASTLFRSHLLVNTALSKLAETAPSRVGQFKHLLLQRLLSSRPSRLQAESLCSILCRIEDGATLVGLLQKLLFSPGEGSDQPTGERSRVVRGLCLANSMIEFCGSLSQEDLDCIRQWVSRVLLPTNRRSVDPEIGIPGLGFLSKIRSVDKKCESDTFNCFKMVLANTGLIQVLQQYQSKRKDSDGATLAYTMVPDSFKSHTVSTSKTRQLVFCTCFFVRQSDLLEPSAWVTTVRWVSDLVNTYLGMGREKSNGWTSSGWLQAAIELHDAARTSSLRKRKEASALDWIARELSTVELSRTQGKLVPRIEKDLSAFLSKKCSISGLRRLTDSYLNLTLSILVGISVSFAVLRNAFEHTESAIAPSGAPESGEMRLLMQFQLAKVYHLSSKLTLTDCLLNAIHSIMRGKTEAGIKKARSQYSSEDEGDDGEPTNEEQLVCRIEEAIRCSRSLRDDFFTQSRFFPLESLWKILNVLDTGRVIDNAMESGGGVESRDRCTIIQSHDALKLTVNVLDHLRTAMDPSDGSAVCMSSNHLVFCARMSLLLASTLPSLRRYVMGGMEADNSDLRGECISMVIQMAASYLNVLSTMLASVGDASSTRLRVYNETGAMTFAACIRLLAEKSLPEATNKAWSDSESAEAVFECFHRALQDCDVAGVSDALLEVLSVLTLHCEHLAFDGIVEVNWISLHTVYSYVDEPLPSCRRPYAFEMVLKEIRRSSTSETLQSLQNVVEETLRDASRGTSSSGVYLATMKETILRHWGLLLRSSSTLCRHMNHISELILALSCFVDTMLASVGGELSEEKKESDVSKPVHRNTAQSAPDIPGLDGTSFADFFEIVMSFVIAAAGAAEPALVGKLEEQNRGPYHHLEDLFKFFRRMLRLYERGIVLFPRRTARIVVQGCRRMFAVAGWQVKQCAEWRCEQPVPPSADHTPADDPASITHFRSFLDAAASHIVGGAVELCELWRSSEFRSSYNPQQKLLHSAAEKARSVLCDVASSHNLDPPVFSNELTEEPMLGERVDVSTEGFHIAPQSERLTQKRGAAPISRHMHIDRQQNEAKRQRLSIQDSADDEISHATPSDTDSAFVASGAWGDDFDDDESSTGSLTLQQPIVIRKI